MGCLTGFEFLFFSWPFFFGGISARLRRGHFSSPRRRLLFLLFSDSLILVSFVIDYSHHFENWKMSGEIVLEIQSNFSSDFESMNICIYIYLFIFFVSEVSGGFEIFIKRKGIL